MIIILYLLCYICNDNYITFITETLSDFRSCFDHNDNDNDNDNYDFNYNDYNYN